jgi:hypothetical protein
MKGITRIELYEMVRDATTVTGAQRALLDAIAWRAKAEDRYSCDPSYARLVHDTHYTARNLQIAAQKLEEAKYIKRVTRSNRSNVFFLNVSLL